VEFSSSDEEDKSEHGVAVDAPEPVDPAVNVEDKPEPIVPPAEIEESSPPPSQEPSEPAPAIVALPVDVPVVENSEPVAVKRSDSEAGSSSSSSPVAAAAAVAVVASGPGSSKEKGGPSSPLPAPAVSVRGSLDPCREDAPDEPLPVFSHDSEASGSSKRLSVKSVPEDSDEFNFFTVPEVVVARIAEVQQQNREALENPKDNNDFSLDLLPPVCFLYIPIRPIILKLTHLFIFVIIL
jgi:hypothetical protein